MNMLHSSVFSSATGPSGVNHVIACVANFVFRFFLCNCRHQRHAFRLRYGNSSGSPATETDSMLTV